MKIEGRHLYFQVGCVCVQVTAFVNSKEWGALPSLGNNKNHPTGVGIGGQALCGKGKDGDEVGVLP